MAQIFYPLPRFRWTWVTQKGPDTSDFLHRMTTIDVRGLADGQGADGFILNPQGKIRSYFQLWKQTADEFVFEFDAGTEDHCKDELFSVIEQFTFGERFSLIQRQNVECVWYFPDQIEQEKPGSELQFFNHGDRSWGRPWVTVWGSSQEVRAWASAKNAEELDFEAIERWRIQALRPKVDLELKETTNPLELGLGYAIAQNKGCYPGQEVIEKIISLGSPARRLVRMRGIGQPPAPGASLCDAQQPGIEIGSLTSWISTSISGDQFSALGLIKKTHAKDGLHVQIGQTVSAKVDQVSKYS